MLVIFSASFLSAIAQRYFSEHDSLPFQCLSYTGTLGSLTLSLDAPATKLVAKNLKYTYNQLKNGCGPKCPNH